MVCHRFLLALLVVVCLGATSRTALGGSVVINGGFETGNFAGWTLSGNNAFTMVSDHDFVSKDSGSSYAPHGGSDFALLGSEGSVGEMSQTIATTPGQDYTFSWWLASDGDYINQFSAMWNGITAFDRSDVPTQGYVPYSFTEVATSTTTTIAFTYRDDPGYLSLDDVSVTMVPGPSVGPQGGVVPEPSALVLACLGGVTIAVAGRRSWSSRLPWGG